MLDLLIWELLVVLTIYFWGVFILAILTSKVCLMFFLYTISGNLLKILKWNPSLLILKLTNSFLKWFLLVLYLNFAISFIKVIKVIDLIWNILVIILYISRLYLRILFFILIIIIKIKSKNIIFLLFHLEKLF